MDVVKVVMLTKFSQCVLSKCVCVKRTSAKSK